MKPLHVFPERSLLVRLGLVLGLLTVFGLASMVSTMIIAETTKGQAAAINLAGGLRMKTYRVATLLVDRSGLSPAEHAAKVEAAMDELEATLISPRLTITLPSDPHDERRMAYERVLANWSKAMRPLFGAHLVLSHEAPASQGARDGPSPPAGSPQFLPSVAVFVDRVDQFVKLLENDIESKNLLLRLIQITGMLLTLGAVAVTVLIFQRGVLTPLHRLLQAADSIRSHDLTARVEHTAPDELGQLGKAFNLMAEELSRLYQDLERRVDEKTASLERSNRSLDLLYKSIGRLYQRPVSSQTYTQLLKDVEETIGVGSGSVCLTQQEALARGAAGVVLRRVHGDEALCSASDCDEAFCGGARRWRETKVPGAVQVLSLPLGDIEGYYGILQWGIPRGAALEPWQLHLLEALSTHMGNAVGAARRIEQKRRWALHEERTIIARELHDSLAQSLSYLKIQVSRLQLSLEQQGGDEKSQEVLSEMREGVSTAYRQLRELLSTFRLKIEHGLVEALDKAVAEFSSRGAIPIDLTTTLDACELTPNEEIHLLQIVRESLANIIHHAHAGRASVSIGCGIDGTVNAVIEDDGVGIEVGSPVAKSGHYGHTIMEERARNLNGTLSVLQLPAGGTRISLRFVPAMQPAVPLRLDRESA